MIRGVGNLLTAALLLSGSLSLQAHPGHSHLSEGVTHMMTSGYHTGVLIGLGLLFTGIGCVVKQSRIRRGATAGAFVCLLLATISWAVQG